MLFLREEKQKGFRVIYKTDLELHNVLVYWQRVLRLQDWDISISFGSPHDHNRASTIYSTQSKRARMTIAPEELIQALYPTSVEPMDHEADLVHELIHLLTFNWNPPEGTTDWLLMEQSVEQLAKALLALNRKEPSNV